MDREKDGQVAQKRMDGKGAGDHEEGNVVIPEPILAEEEEGARTRP